MTFRMNGEDRPYMKWSLYAEMCYPCSNSICLGSVAPSPYKVALHKSHTEQEVAPEAARLMMERQPANLTISQQPLRRGVLRYVHEGNE